MIVSHATTAGMWSLTAPLNWHCIVGYGAALEIKDVDP